MKQKIGRMFNALLLWIRNISFRDYGQLDGLFNFFVIGIVLYGIFLLAIKLLGWMTFDNFELWLLVFFFCLIFGCILFNPLSLLLLFIGCVVKNKPVLKYDDCCLYIRGKCILFQDIEQMRFGENWVVIFFSGTYEIIYISPKDEQYKFLCELAEKLNL